MFEVEYVSQDGGKTLLCRAKGEITEVAKLQPVEEHIAKIASALQLIRFDLEGVSRINSYGVKNWLLLLRSIPSRIRTEFERVSEPLIEQALILPDFLGRDVRRVKDFFAPFLCEQCNQTHSLLISMPEFAKDQTIVERQFHCPKCKSLLRFDGLIEEYSTLTQCTAQGSGR